MKELFYTLSEDFTAYSGDGKLAVIFLAALIVLFVIWNSDRGRVHPLLFVLSVWTGIACAFTELLKKTAHSEDRNRRLFVVLGTVFVLFAISLSGSRIWSGNHLADPKETAAKNDDLAKVVQLIGEDSERPGILASADMMIRMEIMDGKLVPLYQIPKDGGASFATEEDSKLYETFADIHPDFTMIHRLLRNEGSIYVVIDNQEKWPLNPPEQDGFELFSSVNTLDIYKYTGGAYE